MRPVVTRRIGALVVVLGLIASLAAAAPVLAASIIVTSLADAVANNGECTLREAIIAADTNVASGGNAGECAAGTVAGSDAITFNIAGPITPITLGSDLPLINSSMSIDGAGAITVSGASTHDLFHITAGTVSLSGLTITAGSASVGGGIFNLGNLTVTNSTITGNTALDGGGILNDGSLSVTNSTISGNFASAGGGVDNNGSLTLNFSTVSGNTAGDGAGVETGAGASLTVANSTVSGNSAFFHGGGIRNLFGTVAIVNSTFSSNTAGGLGGAIFTEGSTTGLSVTNSTISENAAHGAGGILSAGAVTVTNSTISGNTANFSAGGGIRAFGTETLVNSIVAGNTAPVGFEPDIDGPIDSVTTSVIDVPVADILDPDGLADNGGPTETIALALVAGNPAIDLATGSECAAAPVSGVDQRGLPRPALCDIGAYEAQPPTIAAHANVSAAATSAAGAAVSYTPPAGTDEQDGPATVACLPASGSTFAVGSTTVTCTATDAVGHTASGTFQVIVGALAATPTPALLPNTAVPNRTAPGPAILLMLGLLGCAVLARVSPRGS